MQTPASSLPLDRRVLQSGDTAARQRCRTATSECSLASAPDVPHTVPASPGHRRVRAPCATTPPPRFESRLAAAIVRSLANLLSRYRSTLDVMKRPAPCQRPRIVRGARAMKFAIAVDRRCCGDNPQPRLSGPFRKTVLLKQECACCISRRILSSGPPRTRGRVAHQPVITASGPSN
jgi:hypothetical protein